jgi:predicted SprT family Zn-dependent metalloprotease
MHVDRRQAAGSSVWTYQASIELSCKVVDSEYRLMNTLVHEMCHAATWLIDNTSKPPHGPQFKVHNTTVLALLACQ